MSPSAQPPDPGFEPPLRSGQPPDLRAGERPLKAFISSVMRGALNAHRQAVVSALDGVPWLTAWAFEFTPPSSDPSDSTYLRHVREADFVVWLVGNDVTGPVIREIREAIASDRRIMAITLTDSRTAECEALLKEAGARVKYGRADAAEDVAKVVSLAMSDEIVRALRGAPGLGRIARIEELGRASQAYCVARWQAAGLARDTALELADDGAVGRLPEELIPDDPAPVVLLTGDLGCGKSIASQRYHQRSIQDLLGNASAPIPVWMTASRANAGRLDEQVLMACDGLGD